MMSDKASVFETVSARIFSLAVGFVTPSFLSFFFSGCAHVARSAVEHSDGLHIFSVWGSKKTGLPSPSCLILSIYTTVHTCIFQKIAWEIMLFIGKPIGRSLIISNASNPLKESRKESLLRCAGSTSICEWLVCDLVVCVYKLLVTVP